MHIYFSQKNFLIKIHEQIQSCDHSKPISVKNSHTNKHGLGVEEVTSIIQVNG